ncbi:MAG: hypothetical protein AB8B72_06240 [Crocinitomicaceae bacterium]
MMKNNEQLYSFEKRRKKFWHRVVRGSKWLLGFFKDDNTHENDKVVFFQRFGIENFGELQPHEQYITNAFLRNNLYNIFWYGKKIRKENRILNVYYALTLTVLIGVPIFIFAATNKGTLALPGNTTKIAAQNDTSNTLGNAEKPIEWAESTSSAAGTEKAKQPDNHKQEALNKAKAQVQAQKDELAVQLDISSIITIVITSLLALLKFISSWLDQRKVVVEFSRASVALKNIYYEFENEFKYEATGGSIGFEGARLNQKLSDEFLDALKDETVLSRRVVDAETQKYYELRALPSFDIGTIWQNSASAAKNAFSTFKSSTFQPEELAKRIKTSEEKIEGIQEEIRIKKEELEKTFLKLKHKRNEEEKISLKLDELEEKEKNTELSGSEQARLDTYTANFAKIDAEADALDEKQDLIEFEIKMLEARLAEGWK